MRVPSGGNLHLFFNRILEGHTSLLTEKYEKKTKIIGNIEKTTFTVGVCDNGLLFLVPDASCPALHRVYRTNTTASNPNG